MIKEHAVTKCSSAVFLTSISGKVSKKLDIFIVIVYNNFDDEFIIEPKLMIKSYF